MTQKRKSLITMWLTPERTKRILILFQIALAALMIWVVLMGGMPAVLADNAGTAAATDALDGVVKVVSLITNIVGIIFVVVGFVRYVMAHANDDGPSQQKAALFIGTGIALFLVGSILTNMNISTWIANANK